MRWTHDPLLSVEHLTMRFGGLVAVDDLSFHAGRGDITALIGPNGAGKTTVFNCITGFYKPTERPHRAERDGEVAADEIDALNARRHAATTSTALFLLERMPDFEIAAQARVARTFQNIRLFPGMTVLENLIVAQHNTLMRASGFTVSGLLGLPGYRQRRGERHRQRAELLARAASRLTDRADDPAGDLPYGDQRRLEIARAMCTDPVLLCLDEPAAGLNPRESAELNSFCASSATSRTSILLIEHDMSVVMEISDHVVVLEYGCKIADGTPGDRGTIRRWSPPISASRTRRSARWKRRSTRCSGRAR